MLFSRGTSGIRWLHVPADGTPHPGDFRPAFRETILASPRSVPETLTA